MYFHRVGKNYTKAHLDFNDPLSATLVQYYVKPIQLIGSLHLKQQIMRESISLSWLTGSLPLLWKKKKHLCCFWISPYIASIRRALKEKSAANSSIQKNHFSLIDQQKISCIA